MLVMMQAQGF
jgi:hypothetical protein